MIQHDIAIGIIRTKRGYLLTQRKLDEAIEYPGYWELPGGKALPGEPVFDALHRELLEELGIVIEGAQLLTTVDTPLSGRYGAYKLHYFEVQAFTGDIEPIVAIGFGFFDLQEAAGLKLMPHDLAVIYAHAQTVKEEP